MNTSQRILKELQLYINQINSGVEYDYMQIAAGTTNGALELAMIGIPTQAVSNTMYQEDEFGDVRATAMPVAGVELQ